MKRLIYRIVLLLAGLITACSSPQQVMPTSHDLGTIALSDAGMSITVNAPVWLWNARIRYRLLYKDATAIAYYNQDRWEAPVPALLERRLIVPTNAQVSRLIVELTQFEQQFKALQDARVVMALTVSAISNNDHVLATRTFTLAQQTESADAKGAIKGFVALTEQANQAIAFWLQSLADK